MRRSSILFSSAVLAALCFSAGVASANAGGGEPLNQLGYTPCIISITGGAWCDGIGVVAPVPGDDRMKAAYKQCEDTYATQYNLCYRYGDPSSVANCQANAQFNFENCIQQAIIDAGFHP